MTYSAVRSTPTCSRPPRLRHLLLRVAEQGLYRPLWTERIWDETRAAVSCSRRRARPRRADLLIVFDGLVLKIQARFDDAMVTGLGGLGAGSMSNHPGDRHVLAAGVRGRADAIVTDNLKHFGPDALAPYDIEAQTPDQFLLNQLSLSPDAVRRSVEACAATTGKGGRPVLPAPDWLVLLDRSVPEFVAEARPLW